MKPEIRYGIITGLGVCLWVVIEYLLGFHTTRMDIGQYTGYVSAIVPILAYSACLKEIRKKSGLGYIQALKSGFVISVVAALILVGFFYVYNVYINPGWIQSGIEFERSRMLKDNLTVQQTEEQLAQIRLVYSLPVQLSSIAIGTIIQGALLSLIITAGLKFKSRNTKNESLRL